MRILNTMKLNLFAFTKNVVHFRPFIGFTYQGGEIAPEESRMISSVIFDNGSGENIFNVPIYRRVRNFMAFVSL